ncbi:response regulator transcription factor [Alkalihalobacterium alkalinitrilicum]|uniref:response regulator transcription factor n=1 Tax=Alkalihalobacterium alkalinitrilicum TaxID=427920 RepID=UPI000B109537|nr:response regulator transcription factor [Alkalihalobacterium alkalinitrilicum]
MKKKNILIVDDERDMRELISICLQGEYETIEAENGDVALELFESQPVDLVLLDVMMPIMDGFSVLSEMKQIEKMKDIPVILLTALGDTDDIVRGLTQGADDYIVKPFEPREMVARIQSVLRRSAITEDTFEIHQLIFDQEKYQVSYNGKIVPLTKKEFQLFFRLASRPGRVYSREQLVELEWDFTFDGDARNVDAHIKNIREKLKKTGYTHKVIETVWGIGYQVVQEL